MNGITKNMQEHPFFNNFKPEQVELLSDCASSMRFTPGAYMFREGQTADKLYLIEEGMITVALDMPGRDPLAIMSISAGGVVGLSWLFPPNYWHFSVRANKDTSVISLDTPCLLAKCEQNYQLGYELMCRCTYIMGERLKATRAQLLNAIC